MLKKIEITIIIIKAIAIILIISVAKPIFLSALTSVIK